MNFENDNFICPLCRAPLKRGDGILFCTGARRHCYDISSAGYVNLLPPGKASNAKTGDDKGMLLSRRSFLDTGCYEKISDSVAAEISKNFENKKEITFIDAGCGEGYHTLNIEKKLEGFENVNAIGIEASKHGALLAAKRAAKSMSGADFIAGNIFDMPVKDSCADAVVSMFAPVPDAESARVLKDDGILIVASSGKYHLWEMRKILYGNPIVSEPLSRVPEGFYLHSRSSLEYDIEVEGSDKIGALFEMTPFYYRCPKDGRQRILELENLKVKVEVEFNIYKRIDRGSATDPVD